MIFRWVGSCTLQTVPICLSLVNYCLFLDLFILNSYHQRMTDDNIQPNDRMMGVLERAYNLPCNKPVIAVSSCQ